MINRGELRTTALRLESRQADNDDDFEDEVNEACIDVALKRLSSEVPEALLPDVESVTLFADMTDSTLSRTLAATSDTYVLDFGDAGDGEVITVDGTWDGIMYLEITYNDVVYRRQCREFWLHETNALANHYLVSLDKPWEFPSATGMSFRLYQPYFYTRDDVTKIVDGRLFNSSRALVKVLPAGFVRYAAVEDYRGQSVGPVCAVSRWQHFQMPAPNRAPTVAVTESGDNLPWQTDQEPQGSFKYRYTYVWGRKTGEHAAPGGSLDPMWESAPSPVSAAVSLTNLLTSALLTNLVNIDWQQDFDPVPATIRSSRTGWRKRIYRARSSVDAGGTTVQEIEFPDIYFFLDEVDGDVVTYRDDGSVIPDYHRRLPESHGYWSWAASPHTDANYELDLRVTRRPLKLLVDSDAPQVHPDFEDMLLLLVRRYICDLEKRPADSAAKELEFTGRVEQWRAKDANPADYVPPIPWVPEDNMMLYNNYGRYESN